MNHSGSHGNHFVTAVLFLAITYVVSGVGVGAEDSNRKKQTKSADSTKTRDVEFDKVTLKVPESWKEEPNTSKLRKLDFVIAPVKGDSEGAELFVSYIFDSDGKSTEVIENWVNKFEPDGRKSKLTEGTSPYGNYILVDVTGTYNKQVGVAVEPTRPLPDARMVAAILSVEDSGRYCLILTGPRKTVTAAAKAFRNSFGANPDKEKELKLEEDSK